MSVSRKKSQLQKHSSDPPDPAVSHHCKHPKTGPEVHDHYFFQVAIDGADNAAILAAQMLALSDDALAAQLEQMKIDMEKGVEKKNAALQEKVAAL